MQAKEKDLIEKMEHDGCQVKTQPAGVKNLKKLRKKEETPKGLF